MNQRFPTPLSSRPPFLRPPRSRLFLLLVILLCLGSVIIALHVFRPAPATDDDTLVAVFAERKAEFEELRDMIVSETSLAGIGVDYVRVRMSGDRHVSFWHIGDRWETNDRSATMGAVTEQTVLQSAGLDRPRYDLYLKRLRTLDAQRIEWINPGTETESVSILMFAEGIVPSGRSKAIDFFPLGLPSHYQRVASLDGDFPKGDYYRVLGPGWYIHGRYW